MGHGGNKTQRVDIIDSFDPRIDGRAAQKGTLFRYIPASGAPEMLIKNDDGFSTDWATLGGGGVLPITTVRAGSNGSNIDLSSAPADIGGVTLDVEDLVLIHNQGAAAENGVYTFNGENLPMSRSSGWDEAAEFIPGRLVYIDEGDEAETLWANTNYVENLDVDNIAFINVSAAAGMATDFSNAQPSAVNIDLGGQRITNLAAPSDPTDATNRTYVDDAVDAKLNTDFSNSQPVADTIDMNGNTLVNVPDPSAPGHVANKNYVDNSLSAKMESDFSNAAPAANQIDLNANKIVQLADPTDPTDAANKQYVDSITPPAPTGTPLTFAYYDAAGDLAAGLANIGMVLNPGFVQGALIFGFAQGLVGSGGLFPSANGSMVQGTIVSRGRMRANAQGSFAGGYSSNLAVSGTVDILASANGAFAYGCAESGTTDGAIIFASGLGAAAFGHVANGCQVGAIGIGSFANGHAVGDHIYAVGNGSRASGACLGGGGLIQATGVGSAINGQAGSNGLLDSVGAGSQAFGSVSGGGSFIKSSGEGAFAFGRVTGTGTIDANANGAAAFGYVDTLGDIQATTDASMAFGFVQNGGGIRTGDNGALAFGVSVALNGRVLGNGAGSLAHGYIDGESGGIRTLGYGAHASGYIAAQDCLMDARGDGSFIHGYLNGLSDTMTVNGEGSVMFGFVSGGTMTCDGQGCFVGGWSDGATNVGAGGNGSMSWGREILSTGRYCFSFGDGLKNTAYTNFIIGRFNVDAGGDVNAPIATDPQFQIGKGANDGARADAFRIDKDGKIYESGAKRAPVRIATTSGAVSARADQKIILNDVAAGANTLTLPPGEEGLSFRFGPTATNTGSWALVPDGVELLDVLIPANIDTGNTEITFIGGTWYLI